MYVKYYVIDRNALFASTRILSNNVRVYILVFYTLVIFEKIENNIVDNNFKIFLNLKSKLNEIKSFYIDVTFMINYI